MPNTLKQVDRRGLSDKEFRSTETTTMQSMPFTSRIYSVIEESGESPEPRVCGGSGFPPTWLQPTIDVINELMQLPAGWDSYRASPLTSNAISAAIQLLHASMKQHVPPPSVVPTRHGTIQYEWHTRGIDLEMEVRSIGDVRVSFEDAQTGLEWEESLKSDLTKLTAAFDLLAQRA